MIGDSKVGGGRARTHARPKQVVLKRCSGEAQHPATTKCLYLGSGKRTNIVLKNFWSFACNSVSVRALLLQPPPPGCSSSCAEHVIKLARSPAA
jgi:hypothetical protein